MPVPSTNTSLEEPLKWYVSSELSLRSVSIATTVSTNTPYEEFSGKPTM